MDYSVYKEQTYHCIWDKVLRMGHYLIVAYTTHLPWVKIFSFDTSIGKDICYNEKGVNEKGVPW